MTAKPTSGPRTEFPERSSFSRAMTEHAPLAMAIVEGPATWCAWSTPLFAA